MNKENLILAFSSFNSAAGSLEESYKKLHERIEEMSIALSQTNNQLKKELEEKKALSSTLETVLESLPSAVVVVRSGYISMTNRIARSWFGEQVSIGYAWQDFLHHAQATSVASEVEFFTHTKGMMRMSIARTYLSCDIGEELFILHDVTELSFMRESLARKERLEAIGQMTAELSHQIRTPLSSIMIYAHHLKNQDIDQDKRNHFLTYLHKGLYQIEALVRDMLSFVKGDKYTLEWVLATDIIEEVLIATNKKSEEKSIPITINNTIDLYCYLHCHASSLVSAIVILLENAIEASQSGQSVCIDMSCINDMIHIAVIDEGKGIPDVMLNRIFQPFCSMSKRGTGLGLSIVKMVAESHGGTVEVASNIDKGSTFKITIPFKKKVSYEKKWYSCIN